MDFASNGNHPVRVRFAPSPTGHLHVGGLRTALFNFLFARHHGGSFLLRIEDTDTERSRPEFATSIISSLTWSGLVPDESVVVQSHRDDQHKQVIQQLLDAGKAYRCYCSPEQLASRCAKAVNQESDSFFSYDEHCRHKIPENPEKPFVVRFAVPHDKQEISFFDLIRGPISFDRSHLDDFIIARSDGRPMYNFVVVVDDVFMRITHVIRGEEHISNTPKQLLLYQACGYAVPQFAHLPMILGPDGSKLSKRTGAVAVLDYQLMGYLPEALENYLARLGWSHGDQEIFTKEQLISLFSLDAVGKKGAIFDVQKLDWINSHYIRQRSALELFSYLQEWVMPAIGTQILWDVDKIHQVIGLYKDRVKTIKELGQELLMLYCGPASFDHDQVSSHTGADTAVQIEQLIEALAAIEQPWSSVSVSAAIKQFVALLKIKFVDLAHPVRLALIGKADGPGVTDLLLCVGKDEALKRLNALRDFLLSTI